MADAQGERARRRSSPDRKVGDAAVADLPVDGFGAAGSEDVKIAVELIRSHAGETHGVDRVLDREAEGERVNRAQDPGLGIPDVRGDEHPSAVEVVLDHGCRRIGNGESAPTKPGREVLGPGRRERGDVEDAGVDFGEHVDLFVACATDRRIDGGFGLTQAGQEHGGEDDEHPQDGEDVDESDGDLPLEAPAPHQGRHDHGGTAQPGPGGSVDDPGLEQRLKRGEETWIDRQDGGGFRGQRKNPGEVGGLGADGRFDHQGLDAVAPVDQRPLRRGFGPGDADGRKDLPVTARGASADHEHQKTGKEEDPGSHAVAQAVRRSPSVP